MTKGPNYREARNINWSNVISNISSTLKDCSQRWATLEKVDQVVLGNWRNEVWNDVLQRIKVLEKASKAKTRTILGSPSIRTTLQDIHRDYVIVPTDKAANNFAIVCKKFYIEQSMRELGIFHNRIGSNPTYVQIKMEVSSIVERHHNYMKRKIGLKDVPDSLPFIYWIPKMHKKPHSKQRYIAASYSCTTKPVSALLTKCFEVIEKTHRKAAEKFCRSYGVNPMWILNNSSQVQTLIAPINKTGAARNLRTYDFSTSY